MNDKIKEDVKAKVLQYLSGNSLETNKVEFKQQWYNLKDKDGKVDFLKDTTALVNSYGGDDAFIIIGVTKNHSLLPAKLFDSGYSDQADLKNIVDSHIDHPFRFDIDYVEVNGVQLSVIHIYPSTEKPHVILKYIDGAGHVREKEIWLRSGTANVRAGRVDLDRMYVERHNIIVERKAEISLNFQNFQMSSTQTEDGPTLTFMRGAYIENRGTRDLVIFRVHLEIFTFPDSKNPYIFISNTTIGAEIVIPPNRTHVIDLEFSLVKMPLRSYNIVTISQTISDAILLQDRPQVSCMFTLATGEVLPAIVFVPRIPQVIPDPAIRNVN